MGIDRSRVTVTGAGTARGREGGLLGHVTDHPWSVISHLVLEVIGEEVLIDEQGRQKVVTELLNLVTGVSLVRGLQDHSPVRGRGLLSVVTGPELQGCHDITASQGRHLWIREVSGPCPVIVIVIVIVTGDHPKTGSV